MYQGALLSYRLKYLNKAASLQICKNVTGSIEGHQVGPKALLQALPNLNPKPGMSLCFAGENNINLVVSTPTAELQNLIPHQSSGNTALLMMQVISLSIL